MVGLGEGNMMHDLILLGMSGGSQAAREDGGRTAML